jgi:tetratricopeptide (TPR) repeat protein
MNFTTQAAQDVLGKIEHDPAELRHWRQLLILCFDQKSVDALQTLQVIVAALEQIWNWQRQLAKKTHDEAQLRQRATGSREPLPSLAVVSLPLTVRQKETLNRLARNPQSPALLYRFGHQLEEDFELFQMSLALYERALALDPDDDALENKLMEGVKRLKARSREADAPPAEKPADLGDVIAPESMGVKSPSHHRPSAAALIKRTGRLTLDRGRIQMAPGTANDAEWPAIQKKLDETMSRLLARAATLCETAPRPMRLPRSIAPSQWLEFLEGHIALLLATLEAQEITIRPSMSLEQMATHDVPTRADLVLSIMEEIESSLAGIKVPTKTSTMKTALKPAPVGLESIFEWIEAGSLFEAESHLREMDDESLPEEQLSEVWFHLGLAFQNNHESMRAVGAYQRARELNPQNLQAWFNSGMILHEGGVLQAALECYNRAIDVDCEQPKIWCNLGALQFQLGEFEESVQSLNRAVALKPDYARAWDNLAGSLCALDQLAEAERCCHRAINFKLEYADPFFKLGSIYFQQNRLDEAEKAFRKALEWQPGYPLAGHYLAMVLARTHRVEEALQICHLAAAPAGETELPALAWNEMAYHLYEKGEYAQAIRAYEKALSFTPERAVTWLDAGVAHHQLGNLAEAQSHYNQAVTLDPELARAWHNLGTVRHELGDQAGGRKALEEAERLLAR